MQVIDNAVIKTASAVDRMKKLLTSRDKKATILEMAEANEIDQVRFPRSQPHVSRIYPVSWLPHIDLIRVDTGRGKLGLEILAEAWTKLSP